jgi:hypothetical protein
MEIKSPTGRSYVVGSELGSNERFKFYQCAFESDKTCILKIARKPAFNGLLDREVFLLQNLAQEALALEAEYQKVNQSDKLLNYHFFFPRFLESFISLDQGGSRISVISFSHVANDLSDLTPLSYLKEKEEVRIDPRSSAWILGKLLTMLAFLKDQSVFVTDLSGDNIFINRSQHYVMLFDWTQATWGNGEMSKDLVALNISKITKEVIKALDGDLVSKKLPENEQLINNDYEKYLFELSSGVWKDFILAHKKFYDMVLSVWPREFYRFKTYCLTKKMED